MNEEEVKTKIVLPYLQRLGLQPGELSFEASFSLQIGTNKVVVNGRDSTRGVVGGRLDTLIKRGATNLLILELKETGHALTDDDRDQAISYARLVHPIAPYAVLTNGTTWRIFDTITKTELKPEEIAIKDVYRLTLPETDRDDALGFFLGHSVENLLQFCRSQVNEQLKPLVGSPQDLSKKYIPELTTQRAALLGELASFEKAANNGFLLLAEAGVGKTSALCDYALRRLAERKPTLFFAGASLESGLMPALTGEFGWTFSEDLTPVVLLRRLNELAKDAPVVVVVDAIDEWSYSQRAASLLNLLRGSRDFRVKFVFSCRTAAWEGISQPFGSDIGFASYLFRSSGNEEPAAGHQLATFTDQEFSRTIDSYREVFKVDAWFEDKALDEARANPFLLRVMFAVAAESGDRRLTFSSRDFFERYLNLLLRKSGQREQAEAQILALARSMFERNEECVSHADARRALSLSPAEALMPALLEQNILQRRGGGYVFYFQHLRNYLIAFKVCDWTSANPAQLAAVKREGVHRDALAFFLRYANEQQIQAVTDPVWKHAHEYLELYATLVGRYVPKLDQDLVPGNAPALGFIAEYMVQRRMIGAYGFRRRESTEPAVLLVPVDKFFSRSNLLGMNGAGELHHVGSVNGFVHLNILHEVVEHELIDRVEQVLKKRRLNLRGCDKLTEEALVSAVYHDRSLFASFFDSYSQALRFPVATKEVHNAIQRAKLRCHFEHEVIEAKRRNGTLKETWSGGFVSYSRKFTAEEEAEISSTIEGAMTAQTFPKLRAVTINLRELEESLNRAGVFQSLPVVERLPWFTAYGLSQEIWGNYDNGLALVRAHIRALYDGFLRTYQTVIDTNFPALKDAFPLRAQMPVRLFLNVEVDLRESRNEINGWVVTACEPLPKGSDNEVVMCSREDLVSGGSDGIRYRDRVVTDHYHVGADLRRRTYSMGDLLLTDMVYERITEEWPVVANHLRRREGVPTKASRDRPAGKIIIG